LNNRTEIGEVPLYVLIRCRKRNNEAVDIHMPAASENINLKFYL